MKIRLVRVVLLAAFVLSLGSASAGVCKIGTTEYDTLAEAFATTGGKNTTIELLQDVTLTETVTIPQTGQNRLCILDGKGHTIFQGSKTKRMFYQNTYFTYVTFKNVTFCGGGEELSTADKTEAGVGTLYYSKSGSSTITFDTGCVISNFVFRGPLIYAATDNFVINEGALVADNIGSAADAYSGGVFKFMDGGGLTINGGVITRNTGWYGAVAHFYQGGSSLTINGGVISNNVALGNWGVFTLYASNKVTMNGGLITANTSTATGGMNTGNGKVAGFRFQSSGKFYMNGGTIIGNDGVGVVMPDAGCKAYVKGRAILAGDGQYAGYLQYTTGLRIHLAGDFTGYWELMSYSATSWMTTSGNVIATNDAPEDVAAYTGAENLHMQSYPTRIGVTGVAGFGSRQIVSQVPDEAYVGNKGYKTLTEALAGAADGATIRLATDCCDATPLVPPAKTLTINGDGHRIFRRRAKPLFDFTTAGASLTLTNLAVWGGEDTRYVVRTNEHTAGAVALFHDDAAAALTLKSDVAFDDFGGTNSLFALAAGSTLGLDGVVVTNLANRIVDAPAGTLGIRGATVVRDNLNGNLDVGAEDILHLTGDFTGAAAVTVNGVGPYAGQVFGRIDGDFDGSDNFLRPEKPRMFVTTTGGKLCWSKNGLILLFR